MAYYNPIVRTFCQIRSVLVDHFGIERCRIQTATPLIDLVPETNHRELVELVRGKNGIPNDVVAAPAPPSRNVSPLIGAAILMLIGLAFYVAWQEAVVLCIFGGIAAVFVLLALLEWCDPTTWVKEVPGLHLGEVTVGHLAIWLTHFGGHKESGYQWTRNEIALKVRLIIANQLWLPLDAIQEETKFVDIAD